MHEDLNFEYGDVTTSKYGCGASLHNVFWYFGGAKWEVPGYHRQVKLQKHLLDIYLFQASKIVGCKLERQTDWDFDFYQGACNTFGKPDQQFLLCFDWDNKRQCHQRCIRTAFRTKSHFGFCFVDKHGRTHVDKTPRTHVIEPRFPRIYFRQFSNFIECR